MPLLVLSLLANIVITGLVSTAIFRATAGMDPVFGGDTPARRILACVYAAIGLVSAGALAFLATGQKETALAIARPLLVMQIIYKCATLWAVGPSSPVVITNLFVVVLHCITLAVLWREFT